MRHLRVMAQGYIDKNFSFSISSSRPASVLGMVPPPGEYGLVRGSIYRFFIQYYEKNINQDNFIII